MTRESLQTHRAGWYGHVTTAQGFRRKPEAIVRHFLGKNEFFAVCNAFQWESGRTERMDKADLRRARYCRRCLNKIG